MRISDAALLLSCLAGCSAGAPSGAHGDMIDCALASAPNFTHDCTVERVKQAGATLLIVYHPDGGFRRFKLLDGGKSLAAADGAEALAIARSPDRVDVSVDSDRYRFPAAMLSDDGGR
jgi:hypothetical protein